LACKRIYVSIFALDSAASVSDSGQEGRIDCRQFCYTHYELCNRSRSDRLHSEWRQSQSTQSSSNPSHGQTGLVLIIKVLLTLALGCLRANFLVVLLRGGKILTCLRELALVHTNARLASMRSNLWSMQLRAWQPSDRRETSAC
ncbi:hypothetical protein THAOC_20500, partial [Thalassiosira oceanica]